MYAGAKETHSVYDTRFVADALLIGDLVLLANNNRWH